MKPDKFFTYLFIMLIFTSCENNIMMQELIFQECDLYTRLKRPTEI